MLDTPLKTFIIYARNDSKYKDELLFQLTPLIHNGMINLWHDGDLKPGEEWEVSIKKNLKASEIILVLVSKYCLNSDFIQTQELQMALTKMKEGNARIVPIIVSSCLWEEVALFKDLQNLPPNTKPISTWQDEDEAWTEVARGIRSLAQQLHKEKAETERLEKLALEKAEKERLEKMALEKAEKERLEKMAFEKAEKERLEKIALEKAERERLEKDAKEPTLTVAELVEAPSLPEAERLRMEKEQNTQKFAAVVSPDQQRRIEPPKVAEKENPILLFWQKYKIHTLSGLALLLAIFFLPKLLNHNNNSITPTKAEVTPPPITTPPISNYTETVNGVSFVMKAIPGHSFYMGETEVTQALWQAVMGASTTLSNPSNFKNCSQCPVEQVSWDDVQDFIKKLNQLTGKTYRLPKEAEWEYAAKGGQSYTYSGSNNIGEVAWYGENSGDKTHPVKQKKANGYGLYDMSGNVWEWCEDIYSGSGRVYRGGSWGYDAANCRVAGRDSSSPVYRYGNLGFRLSRTL